MTGLGHEINAKFELSEAQMRDDVLLTQQELAAFEPTRVSTAASKEAPSQDDAQAQSLFWLFYNSFAAGTKHFFVAVSPNDFLDHFSQTQRLVCVL